VSSAHVKPARPAIHEVDWTGSSHIYSSSAFGPILSDQSGSSDLIERLVKPIHTPSAWATVERQQVGAICIYSSMRTVLPSLCLFSCDYIVMSLADKQCLSLQLKNILAHLPADRALYTPTKTSFGREQDVDDGGRNWRMEKRLDG